MRVRKKFFLYNLILVIALAGAKSDLYEEQQVTTKETKKEAKKFAKKINALFKMTSAENNRQAKTKRRVGRFARSISP